MSETSRDLILRPNEFAYILDSTKGIINVACGPYKVSLSNSDFVCRFSEETKRFENCSMEDGIQKFIIAPDGFYIELKNPAAGNKHPSPGTLNSIPDLEIGRKINIPHDSFALYPGQMARVIRGHQLRSNQYLIAKVYDNKNLKDLNIGDLIIIKGETFYIPPTGVEVVPAENGEYIRQATVLEALQYCILVSENGKRRYVHGPAIVFPEIGDTFIMNPETGTPIFKAIELSDISGLYIKVIEDYTEEQTIIDDEEIEDEEEEYSPLVTHKAGEELFITGKDQKIYYPRCEHSIITYDGKALHHAIAIPEGEGRYVLNRMTGEVTTVIGPKMYLPDPRYEVIVHRKLTKKECELWYPGNKEVLAYNVPEENTWKMTPTDISFSSTGTLVANAANIVTTACLDSLDNGFYGQENAVIDKGSGFSRGNTYTKPRTITIDNKYDGVVSIDVWSGYAINVVSKNGNRRTVIGPKTVLLEYDETLEVIENTVFLRIENNTLVNTFTVQTKDFVDVTLSLDYCVNCNLTQKDKWFTIADYQDLIVDTEAALIKKEAKKYTVEEFYNNAAEIISALVLATDPKTKKPVEFSNGMYVTAVNVSSVKIEDEDIKYMFDKHQADIVEKTLKLSSSTKEMSVAAELAKLEKEKADLTYKNKLYQLELESKLKEEEQKKKDEYEKLIAASEKAKKETEKEIETLRSAITKIELATIKEKTSQAYAFKKEEDKMEAEREKLHTDAMKKVLDSISPQLVAALEGASKHEMLRDVAQSLSPYALASGNERVGDVVNKLLRGTSLEGIIDKALDTNE